MHCSLLRDYTAYEPSFLYERSNAPDLQLVALQKDLIKYRQALAAQGIVDVVPTQPIVVNMAN